MAAARRSSLAATSAIRRPPDRPRCSSDERQARRRLHRARRHRYPDGRNILGKGFSLLALDLDQRKVAELLAEGAGSRATAAEVAAASDIVITMAPDAPGVEKVALGGRRPDRGEGCGMVDAPVARTVEHARAGTLAIMTGGDIAGELAQVDHRVDRLMRRP